MIRPILIHPDPRLRKACAPVERFDESLAALIEDMFETMYDAPGIGLAAPQLGVLSQLIVMDCAMREEDEAEEPDPMVVINPAIVWSSDETEIYNEGCLSIPDIYADVTRPARVRVRFQDETGAERERAFDGVRATCIQHEIDHLKGKLFIDYLGLARRQLITSKMKKLKRERAKAV